VAESNSNDIFSQINKLKAVVAIATDLNVSRRNYNAYPSGHPLIESSITKLINSFRLLYNETSELQLGITRDGLLLENDFVEKNNQICRNIASTMFERGIGTLLITGIPSREELLELLRLLALKREEIFSLGGIEKLWQEAKITAIRIFAVRYDCFIGTEEEHLLQDTDSKNIEQSVWEKLLKLLMQGTLGGFNTESGEDIKPEKLAAAMNAYFVHNISTGKAFSSNTIKNAAGLINKIFTGSSEQTDGYDTNDAEKSTGITIDKSNDSADWSDILIANALTIKAELASFISALNPELRRQILNGFFETGQDDNSAGSELFRYINPTTLQKTYATAEEYASAPKLLQEILRKLLPHIGDETESFSSDDEIRTKMHTLLREHQLETFMPDEYLQGIQSLFDDGQTSQFDDAVRAELLSTLNSGFIDNCSSEIILELVFADPTGKTASELIQNLADMCGHFLELGEYEQVLKLLSQAADPRLPQALRIAMRDAFCKREFMDEILSGLKIWGKPKYDQVTLLIQVIGRAFIDPLLDQMTEEENMSLRRFMMDRIQSFGVVARPNLLARLSDRRWYVLRNIIIMLRALEPIDDIERLRPLLKNSNQKVRSEVLKSLLQLGDPVAQRQLLRELESTDRETQLGAISMIDRKSSSEIVRKLTTIVNTGGYTAVECELKSAAIHALGEIGRAEALPELAKLLTTRSLLAFKALNRLKFDLIQSLEHYPPAASIPILERLSIGSDENSRYAANLLKTIRSKRR